MWNFITETVILKSVFIDTKWLRRVFIYWLDTELKEVLYGNWILNESDRVWFDARLIIVFLTALTI